MSALRPAASRFTSPDSIWSSMISMFQPPLPSDCAEALASRSFLELLMRFTVTFGAVPPTERTPR